MNRKKLLNFVYLICGLSVFIGIFFDFGIIFVGIPALLLLVVSIIQIFWEAKGPLKQRVAKISITTLTYLLVGIFLLWIQFIVFAKFMGEDFFDLLDRQTNFYKLILLLGWVIFGFIMCIFANLVIERLLNYFADDDEFDQVEKQYLQLIEAAPQDCENYQRLGEYYRTEKRYDAAEDILKKAISVNPASAQNYLCLGYVLLNGGKYEAAEEMYRKSIELNPNEAAGYFQLGWLLLERKKSYEEAESLFLLTLKLDPDDETALYNLACIKCNYKEREPTFHYLRQAIEQGFDKEWARTDPDLEWVRSDARFTDIVGSHSGA